MGLPSSGGLTTAETLNLLGGFDPTTMSQGAFLHRWLEASRLAFADRNAFLGDPEFVSVPVQGMLSSGYADARRALINGTKASTAAQPAGDPAAFQQDPSGVKPTPPTWLQAKETASDLDPETTHITVADALGNIVTYTCTIESEGGIGAATAIRFNEDGTMAAVAEPVRRNGGSAMVVTP